LPKIDAFIPAYEAALSISDLLTAVLLFGHFSRSGLRALLVLGCAYLFNVFIILPHALSFPGVFAPQGAIGVDSRPRHGSIVSGMAGSRFWFSSMRFWPPGTDEPGAPATSWPVSQRVLA
jgi:hypothetical protein